MEDLFQRLRSWAVETEGSSRSSALIRIGLAMLLWSRYARELGLWSVTSIADLLLSVSFFVATTMMFLGLFTRFAVIWSAIIALIMFYYFGMLLDREPWTHHHTYLLAVATGLCALTPSGRSYSVDRWLALRRAERGGEPPPPEHGNLWGLRLIALQMSALYFFTAYDKSNWLFLSGARLEHLYVLFYGDYPEWPGFHQLAMAAAAFVVVLEYALAFGMLHATMQRYLVLPGIALHAVFYVMLPVYTYSATMILLYLAYFDADKVHSVIDRLSPSGRDTLRTA